MGVGSWGLDGNFYSQIYPRIVRRIGPDLKPVPFSDNASERGDLLNPIKGTMRARGRGIMPPVRAMNRWIDLVEQPTAAAAIANVSPSETRRWISTWSA